MLKHELRQDDEILVLSPKEPLEAADFAALESDLNTYREQHGAFRRV